MARKFLYLVAAIVHLVVAGLIALRLIPSADLRTGRLVQGLVPARCDKRGLLLIGPPPALGPVYDIPLFWMNLREVFARRVSAWKP